MKKVASLALIGVLWYGPQLEVLQAGQPVCRTGHSQVGVGYVAPVYNYATVGHNYGYGTGFTEFVPLVKKIYALPDFAYSTRTDELLEEIRALRLAASQASSNPSPSQNVGTSAPVDDFIRGIKFKVPSDGGGTSNRPYADEMTKLVADSCIRCHDGQKLGRINLSDLTKLSFDEMLSVQNSIVSGDMPPGRPLPKQQVDVAKKWFRSHASK